MNFEEMFEFNNIGRGCELTKYVWNNSGNVTEIEIPSHFNGRPVTRIGDRVFKGAWLLETVHVPDTVTEIGDGAFFGAHNLKNINIPLGVKAVGNSTFRDCEDLSEIIIPEGVKTIESDAFRNTRLRSVTLPQNTESIGDSAFMECGELKSVTFLNSSVRLGKNVFLLCPNLPPETQLMGLVCSTDITRPISRAYAKHNKDSTWLLLKCRVLAFDFDVFRLAVKNNCFRELTQTELEPLLANAIAADRTEYLQLSSENDLITDAELLDRLIDQSAKKEKAEITALLLEYKNRKFGFDNGEKYEL